MQRNHNTQPLHLSTVTLSRLNHPASLQFHNITLAKHPSAETLQLGDMPSPTFAQGFSTDKQMPSMLNCFAPGTVTFEGGGKSVINFGNAISFQDLQKDLSVDVSGKASIGRFSGDLSSSYARHVEQKQYTQAFYYSEAISLPTKKYNPQHYGTNALSEIGQDVYKAGPQQFRDACGDKLIEQAHLGAMLAVTMSVHFSSYYDQSTFNAHAGGSFGSILSVAATIKSVSTQYSLKGEMEFSAYQSGGDPTQLAKIFGNPGGTFPITSCSLDHLNDCDGVINGVLNYAAKDFPAQIDFVNGTVLGSATPTGYVYMDVSMIGLNAGSSVLTPEILAARAQLGDIYQKQTAYLTFVDHILNSPFVNYLATNTINWFRIAKNALDANIGMLSDENTGAPSCYFYPTQCPANRDALMSKLNPVDTHFLDQMNARGFVVSADLYTCICPGCAGESATMNTLMFPLDNYSSSYVIATKPNVKLTVTTTDTTLSIGGTRCPVITKAPGDSHYSISGCPCDYNSCPGINCAYDLGANDNGFPCSSSSCSGALIFAISDNPL